LPPRPVLHDDDIIENFLRGTGPGGQKINKTSCAVQLIHKPTGIVVKCQESRSRTQNRKIARKWLQDKIEEAELGDKARTRLKAEDKRRRKKSMDKKKRRKYRALEEGKNADGE
ncbi:peptidyl-tRNA hydrolase domain-containing protein, partial [Sporormia fimetaria CBS 119925]